MPIEICNAFGPNCAPDWNGVAAVATAVATAAALGVPFLMASIERRKQQANRKAVIHEICSIADRLVVYHLIAAELMDARFPYWIAFESIERIRENVKHLQRSLGILITRSELSDGAVIAASAAEIVATSVIDALATVRSDSDETTWSRGKLELSRANVASKLASSRSTRVRSYFGIPPSSAAAAIKDKYGLVINACTLALANETAPVIEDITLTDY